MTYLAFDGVICKYIKQLVEDFKPGQVAETNKKRVRSFYKVCELQNGGLTAHLKDCFI